MNPLMLFSLVVTLIIFGFCVTKIFTRRGLHRLPGGLAVLVLLLIFINIAFDIRANPTTHNLLPFELVMWSVLGLLIYWLAEAVSSKLVKKHSND